MILTHDPWRKIKNVPRPDTSCRSMERAGVHDEHHFRLWPPTRHRSPPRRYRTGASEVVSTGSRIVQPNLSTPARYR